MWLGTMKVIILLMSLRCCSWKKYSLCPKRPSSRALSRSLLLAFALRGGLVGQSLDQAVVGRMRGEVGEPETGGALAGENI